MQVKGNALTDLEDLSEREHVMFLHRIVTGRTFVSGDDESSPSPAPSASEKSSSASFSGKSAMPGPEKMRTSIAAATAARRRPTPFPPMPETASAIDFPPKGAMNCFTGCVCVCRLLLGSSGEVKVRIIREVSNK